MGLLANIITDITTLSDSINSNPLVAGARASVNSGIKSFMITPKEKAQILANFEMQFTGAIINKIIDATIEARVSEAQIDMSAAEVALKVQELLVKQAQIDVAMKDILLKTSQIEVMNREISLKEALNTAQIALLDQQKLTEVQQTAKASYEVVVYLPAQKLGVDADTAVKTSQKLMLDQQKLTEVQQTAKVTKEGALLDSNKALVDAQKLTQEKQRLDVMAGINIKNEQALSTRQSAKFEEVRRYVLLASTQQNSQIQKSKEENAMFNSMAIDETFVISEAHLTRVKDALDAITVTPVTYTTELSTVTNPVEQVDAGV